MNQSLISWDDFLKPDIRVGTILEAVPFPEAQKPAYRLRIDFGPEVGERRSSAQITDLYPPDKLVGRQVLGVVNLSPKRIAGLSSQVLILGVVGNSDGVVLIIPERTVPNGLRML